MATKPQCVVSWTTKGVARIQYPTTHEEQQRIVDYVKTKYDVTAKVENPIPRPKVFPRNAHT
jgi:hypothetical protein